MWIQVCLLQLSRYLMETGFGRDADLGGTNVDPGMNDNIIERWVGTDVLPGMNDTA